MRVCFVRPRNFPAMPIPCQDLLCEAAGFCACCERTKNIVALKVFAFLLVHCNRFSVGSVY